MSRPPRTPRQPNTPPSDGLRSLESTADIGNDEPPAFEACYSIALHGAGADRAEPSASIELFSPRSRVRKAAPPAAASATPSAHSSAPSTPRLKDSPGPGPGPGLGNRDRDREHKDDASVHYCMTPRSAAAGFDLSKAFSLAQLDGESGDSIDELFGEAQHQDRWDLTAVGLLTALLLNLVALAFALLLPATGRKRTFYAWGVLAGSFVQGVIVALVILERKP